MTTRSDPPSALARVLFYVAANPAVRVLVLLVSVAVLLALGIFSVGHDPADNKMDARYLFLAGKYWLAGLSAYAPAAVVHVDGQLGGALEQYNFAYPPQIAPLCLLLASGSLPTAYVLMDLVNLAALAALAYFCVRLTEQGMSSTFGSTGSAHRWFVPAFVIGNLSTAFVVWTGQTSVIVAAALAGAWYCSRRDRWILAGVFLAVATMKPPLSMFVVLWFGLQRQWRVLLTMAATILIFSAVPMAVSGPIRVFLEWAGAVVNYATHPFNAVGSRMIFNLRSFLNVVGLRTPDLTAIGLVATLILWDRRAAFVEDDILGVLVAFALLFGSGHSYDLAVLVLLIPAFWRYLRSDAPASLVAIALLLVISFPNSMLERFGSDLLLHARVAVVAAAVTWLLVLSARAARGRRCFVGSAAFATR